MDNETIAAGNKTCVSAQARVEVVGAVRSYGPRAVLRGVDLSIMPGEIFGLLGPNGAGKSTLLKAIGGYLSLDQGSVRVSGQVPGSGSRVRQLIGFVPQDIALFSYLTVRENLSVFARSAGLSRRAVSKNIDRVLAQTGLEPSANTRCSDLSGGYKRRVNICASILHNPTVLLLDEPTVGLDVDAREAIHAVLSQLRQNGVAIVITTHDLEQAETICDRVGILFDGKMVLEGRPKDLIKRRFAGLVDVTVVVEPFQSDQLASLLNSGLKETKQRGTWKAFAPASALDIQVLHKQLVGFGIGIKEIRVTEPNLAALLSLTMQTDTATSTVDLGLSL